MILISEKKKTGFAKGDFVIAFYNPVSKRRRTQLEYAKGVLLEHRPDNTPVILATNLGREGELVRVVPLAELDINEVDMLTVVIVGSSETTTVDTGDGKTWVYTPRGYSAKDRWMMDILDFFGKNKDAFLSISVFITAIVSLVVAILNVRAIRQSQRIDIDNLWVTDLQNDLSKFIELAVKEDVILEANKNIKSREFADLFSQQNFIFNKINIKVANWPQGKKLIQFLTVLLSRDRTGVRINAAMIDELSKITNELVEAKIKS